MDRTFYLLAAIILNFIFCMSIAVAEYPGVVPGKFSVSDVGEATYTLPILTPAGVNAMKPDLAITYNSSGDNGLLGVGFQLSGFTSSIHRCGGSHVTDGKATGVTYTNSDKICLDGQRLIRSIGGHWSNGTIYHTENESFSKIIYQDGIFLVYTRDGLIMRYAFKVQASGRVIRWIKSSVHDRTDNVIRFYYQNISEEYWIPREVRWTGKGTTAGNRKAVITYKSRPDKRFVYEYGFKRASNHLIDTIATFINNIKIKKYQFMYQKSPVSGLSRLRYIQQSGTNGEKLPAHYFTYNDVNRGFGSNHMDYRLPVYVYDYKDIKQSDSCGSCNDGYSVEVKRGDFVDLDNDGFVDYVESYRSEDSNVHHRAIYKNIGSTRITGSTWKKIKQKPPVTMRDYFINKNKGTGKGEMLQSSLYADVNGDGFEDIVTSYKNNSTSVKQVLKNKGNFAFESPTVTTYVPPQVMWDYDHLGKGKTAQLSYLIDVNGDGLPDWVVSFINKSGTEYNRTYINTGTGWTRNAAYDFPATAAINDYRTAHKMENSPVNRTEVVDINGDGLVDLIQGLLSPDKGVDSGKTYRKVWLNTGAGWTPANYYKLPDYIHDYTRVNEVVNGRAGNDSVQQRGDFIDVNGDGLVDWVRSFRDFKDDKDYTTTWLNTGKGWELHQGYKLIGEAIRNYNKTLGGDPHGPESGSFFDINRDGLVDWVVSHVNRNGTWIKKTYLNTGVGWAANNSNYAMSNVLVDNAKNEDNVPMHFGGLMDINNDGALDYLMSTLSITGGAHKATYLGNAKPADMLTKVTNSLKFETRIAYKPMSDSRVYKTIYPLGVVHATHIENKVVGSSPLVSSTWQSDGLDSTGLYRLDYYYYGAGYNRRRGSMGFQQTRIWDTRKKRLTLRKYAQKFPTVGTMYYEVVYKADSVNPIGLVPLNNKAMKVSGYGVTSKVYTQPSGKLTYAPRINNSRVIDYELGASSTTPIRTVWTKTVFGAYENPSMVTTITRAGNASYAFNPAANFRTITQYSYKNNGASWLIGLPTQVKVTHSAPNQQNQVRHKQMKYNTLGQHIETVVEPYIGKYRTITTYRYEDPFGNLTSTKLDGQGIDHRTSSVRYDSQGYHPVRKTNALSHVIRMTVDSKCDLPKTITDVNGLVVTYFYDQHCRPIKTEYPDLTWTTTAYGYTPFRIIKNAKNSPRVVTYFDELNREIKIEAEGFDTNQLKVTEKEYNSKGQIWRESLPYYKNATKHWVQYYYDVLDRLWRTIAADGTETRVSYQGLTIVTTNALRQRYTQINDLLLRPKTVRNAMGKDLDYTYDAVGNLISTIDPGNNKIIMKYDNLGRKIRMDDPDMGIWKYEYNVLGELIKQTDASGNVIRTNYDKLGRMENRTTAEGTSIWKYETSTNGIGKLAYTTGPNGYRRDHSYDSNSRPSHTYETIDGVLARSYTSYDLNGRVFETRFFGPNNGHLYGGQSRIRHEYNSRGYLKRIYDYKNVGGQTVSNDLWVADEMDPKGNITKERYGNNVNVTRVYHSTRNYLKSIRSLWGGAPIQNLSYTMDAIGNLNERRDRRTGAYEVFDYDVLNRLEKSTVHPVSGSSVIVDYEYDALGNLKFRSDVGTLKYGERGYGPHAVTTVNRTGAISTEGVFDPYGWYSYDANGNMLKNRDRTVKWTSFNKPSLISTRVGGESRSMSYTYGSDFQRITKTTHNDKITRYYGGGTTEHIRNSNKKYWKYYIPLGKTTLEYKVEETGTNSYQEREYQYLLKDHLGSNDVIVKNNGTIKQRLSFSPWGERRDVDWTEADNEIASSSNRGFTGHEMDDEIGLVNMEARIYDPILGRFLSPDSLIPRSNDLQSYNRYSYVRNNPLSFTDPTGHMGKPTMSVRYEGVRYIRGYNGKGNEVYGYRTIKIVTITEPGASGGSNNRAGAASNSVKHYNRAKGNNSNINFKRYADFTKIIYHSKAGTLTLFGREGKKKSQFYIFEKSFTGNRPLQGFPDSPASPQHGYTVTDADVIGDVKGNIHSYGPVGGSGIGGMKDADLKPLPDDNNVTITDREHWLNQRNSPNPTAQELVDDHGNPIPDEAVRQAHDELSEHLNVNEVDYSGPWGPNSNSATTQANTRAGAVNPSAPGWAPGRHANIPGFGDRDSVGEFSGRGDQNNCGCGRY